jgi:hypothetical protein
MGLLFGLYLASVVVVSVYMLSMPQDDLLPLSTWDVIMIGLLWPLLTLIYLKRKVFDK